MEWQDSGLTGGAIGWETVVEVLAIMAETCLRRRLSLVSVVHWHEIPVLPLLLCALELRTWLPCVCEMRQRWLNIGGGGKS